MTEKGFIQFVTIRDSKYSNASCKTKQSVNDSKNSFKNQSYLYFHSFCIPKSFPKRAVNTSKLKNFSNLGN